MLREGMSCMLSEETPGGQDCLNVSETKTGHFKRVFGLFDATAVVVGSMIGSGIFLVSAEMSRQVGSPGLLLLCWFLAGLMTIAGALCYSELASMFPKAGGQYVFLRQAYGPLVAFLYGWTLFAVIQSGTIAAVGVGFAKFLGVFIPSVSNNNVLLQIGNWKLSVLQVISMGLIALLTYVNCRGIEAAKFIQTTFTSAKVLALAALIILGFLATGKYAGAELNFNDMWRAVDLSGQPLEGMRLLLTVGLAMVGALFSCDAWNNITFAGEEVKDAEKVLPKSLVFGTGAVVLIYLLANMVYLLLLPLHGEAGAATVVGRGIQFAAEDRVATAVAEIIFGSSGAWIMAAAILISTFGCLNGLILAGARVYYAMAKDGLFFKRAAELSPATNVPVFGLIVQGIWSALLAMSGTYSNLLEFVIFAALAFYFVTVLAVIILRVKQPDLTRPYKVVAYPFLPVAYLFACLMIMLGQMILSPMYAGAGLLIILSGLPAYYIWRFLSRQHS